MKLLRGPQFAALVLGALVLTACGSAQDVADAGGGASTATRSSPAESTPPQTTPTETTPTGTSPTETTPSETTPELAGRPDVGDCYDTSRAAFASQRDGSRPVSCSKPHTAETFAVFSVGTLPPSNEIDKVWRDCQPRFSRYVGDSATVSTLGMTVILPSDQQAAAGQGWIRCDAIEQPTYNGNRGLTRTGSVKGALAGSVPAEYRGCALHWPKVDQPVFFSSCNRRHQAELIPESLNLGGPDTTFPGVSVSRSKSQSFCESTFQDYVSETLNYYYYYPTAASWKSGSHDTTCWALDTQGDGLPPI